MIQDGNLKKEDLNISETEVEEAFESASVQSEEEGAFINISCM